jgi:hypothetical protein
VVISHLQRGCGVKGVRRPLPAAPIEQHKHNNTMSSSYELLEAAFTASIQEMLADQKPELRIYIEEYHSIITEAWDRVRNYESPEDKMLNDAYREEYENNYGNE